MSFDLLDYYKISGGDISGFNKDTWYSNYDKKHSFMVYSDIEPYNPSSQSISVYPSEQQQKIINHFSELSGQKVNNTKIVDNLDGTEKIELDLDDRVVTIIIDNSGSMTWNDNDGIRFDIAENLVDSIGNSYSGNVYYNLIKYGSKNICSLLFGTIEEAGVDVSNVNSFATLFQFDSNSNYDGIRVVKNINRYPNSPIDGDIVADGYFSKILEEGLVENQAYYYKIFTYNKAGVFSEGVCIKVIPKERVVPIGISLFKTLVSSEDVYSGHPFIGSGVSRDENTIALWHMDEGDGDYLYDFSESNVVLEKGSERLLWDSNDFVPSGKSGLILNGRGDFVSSLDLDDATEISFLEDNDNLSIVAWIYLFSESDFVYNNYIVSRYDGLNTNYSFKINSDRTMRCYLGDAYADTSSLVLDFNKWYCVSFSYDGGANVVFGLNREYETVAISGTPSYSSSTSSVSSSIFVGKSGIDMLDSIGTFNGKISDLSVHNIYRDSDYIDRQMIDVDVTSNGIVVGERTIGIKEDNGDRLIVLSYEIPDDYDFVGGRVIIVKNEKNIPSWEEDGIIIYNSEALPGIHYVSDPDDFVLGEKYYYRIFSVNSNGVVCFISDSSYLEVNIDVSSTSDYFLPLDSAINSPKVFGGTELENAIVAGNNKICVRWSQDSPLDSRIKRVKIYYSSDGYPIVGKDGGYERDLVYTGLSTDDYFVHYGVPNDIVAYYTIVNIDKYGRASNYDEDGNLQESLLHLFSIPKLDSTNVIPLPDVKNIGYGLIDKNSVSIGIDIPLKSPNEIDAYFDQTVLIYALMTDEFGAPLPDGSSVYMSIESNIVRDDQAEDVFVNSEDFSFEDSDSYDFFVSKTKDGFVSGTLKLSRDSRIISRIKEAHFSIKLKSYIPSNGKYVSYNDNDYMFPNSGPNGAESNSTKNIFEYSSKEVVVNYTNPWEINLESKDINQAVYNQCYYIETDSITKEKTLRSPKEKFRGIYVKSSSPYVARAKLKYKGLPVEGGFIQAEVWDADSSNLCAGASDTLEWGVEGDKIEISKDVRPSSNVISVVRGTERVYDVFGDYIDTEISYADIPLYAPGNMKAVKLFVKGSEAGYSSTKSLFILFQSIVEIEMTNRGPRLDGRDVSEQVANVFVINPDFPNSKNLRTPVPDNTVVQWDIKNLSGVLTRNLYSIDNVPMSNGIYSYTRNGFARNVFIGPIIRPEDDIDEDHIITSKVVYNGMSYESKGIINISSSSDKLKHFDPRFLMEIDGNWNRYGENDEFWENGGWKSAGAFFKILWADGAHYKKVKIHRNPSSSTSLEFQSSEAFKQCSSQYGFQPVELNYGQDIKISAGDEDVEFLYGDITEEIDEYTGMHYLEIGEYGYSSKGEATITLSTEEEITYFYVRLNKFIPDSKKVSNVSETDDDPINPCLSLNEPTGLRVMDLPAWSPCLYVSGITTLYIDNEPVSLYGGGDFYTGLPPCPICLKEPLSVSVVRREVINSVYSEALGDPSDNYMYDQIVVANNNNFTNNNGETLVSHESEVNIRVKVSWKDSVVPDGTPVYISIGNNKSNTLFIASSYIYYTETDADENYSYVDVSISARTVPSYTQTEIIEVYSIYDESGDVDRHKGVSFSLTLDVKNIEIIIDAEDNPSFSSSGYEEITSFSSTMKRYNVYDNSWISLQDMSESKGNMFCGVVEDKIYAIGGLKNNNFEISNKNEEYDINSDTWSFKRSMIVPRFGGMSVTIGNDIYVIGGISPDGDSSASLSVSGMVEVYHADTDSWSILSQFPYVDGYQLSVAFGASEHVLLGGKNYIYIMSGINSATVTDSDFYINRYNDRILRYCVEDDLWEYSDILRTDEKILYNRISPLSIIYNNKIAVFNGAIDKQNDFVYPHDCFYVVIEEIFENTKNVYGKWIEDSDNIIVNDYISNKFQSSIVKVEEDPSGDIYDYFIFGGEKSGYESVDYVENIRADGSSLSYNNSYNSNFSNILSPMPLAKHGHCSVLYSEGYNHYVYVFGGYINAKEDGFVDIKFDI